MIRSLKRALSLLISFMMAWSLAAVGAAYFDGALAPAQQAFADTPVAQANTASNVGDAPASCSTLPATNLTQDGQNLIWYRTISSNGYTNKDNFFIADAPQSIPDAKFVNEGTSQRVFEDTTVDSGLGPSNDYQTQVWRYRARFTFTNDLISLGDLDLAMSGTATNGSNGYLPCNDNMYVFLHPTSMDMNADPSSPNYDRNFALFFGGDGVSVDGEAAVPFTWNGMKMTTATYAPSGDGLDWYLPGVDLSNTSVMQKYSTCRDWTVEIMLENHQGYGALGEPTVGLKISTGVTVNYYKDSTSGTLLGTWNSAPMDGTTSWSIASGTGDGQLDMYKSAAGLGYVTGVPDHATVSLTPGQRTTINVVYTRPSYTLTCDYINENTGQEVPGVSPTQTTELNAATVQLSTLQKAINGYQYDKASVNFPLTISGNQTVKLYYLPDTGQKYTIQYIAEGTNKILGSVTKTDGVVDTTVWIPGCSATDNTPSQTFTGYTYDAANSGNVLSGLINYPCTVALKAYYKADSLTITYNANGGAFSGGATTQGIGGIYAATIAAAPTAPTRDYYEFVKWNTKSDGSGVDWSFGTSGTALTTANGVVVSGSTGSLTLYAQWKLVARDVTIETAYTDPQYGTTRTQAPTLFDAKGNLITTEGGYIAYGSPSSQIPSSASFQLDKGGVCTVSKLPEGQTYELYWSQDGSTNWVDTHVLISATGTLVQIPVYRLTYDPTAAEAGAGIAPDPMVCYAVNHSTYKIAENQLVRVNYGTDGWSAGSASVTKDTVNANPYATTWKVDGADLVLYANWSTACRIYGNVYAGPSTRRPLQYMSVVLMDNTGVISDDVITQADGYFSITPTKVLPSGNYTLFATDGKGVYQDTYVTVQVAQNGFGAATIYMDPVPTNAGSGNVPNTQATASKKSSAQTKRNAAPMATSAVTDKATASAKAAKAAPAAKTASAQGGKPQD